jgi:hypothetical protein
LGRRRGDGGNAGTRAGEGGVDGGSGTEGQGTRHSTQRPPSINAGALRREISRDIISIQVVGVLKSALYDITGSGKSGDRPSLSLRSELVAAWLHRCTPDKAGLCQISRVRPEAGASRHIRSAMQMKWGNNIAHSPLSQQSCVSLSSLSSSRFLQQRTQQCTPDRTLYIPKTHAAISSLLVKVMRIAVLVFTVTPSTRIS